MADLPNTQSVVSHGVVSHGVVSHGVVSHGVIDDAAGVTAVVLNAMSHAPDARLRTIMASFVRHLHAFAHEVRLTEAEFERATEILNEIGQATNSQHNEGVLFSDAVGFSTLVCLLNAGHTGATATASALLGPFWRDNSPLTQNGGSILRSTTAGPALFVDCLVTDPQGLPLADVEVDTWHASPAGMYENQDSAQAEMNLRGRLRTGADGRFAFRTVKPAGYPVPTDGPTGALLRAQLRHPFRPAHLHFMCFQPGFKTLVTQVFVDGDPYLESDAVFGVTTPLIGDYRAHTDEPAPAADVEGTWYSLDYHLVMEPGEAKRPLAPIR